MHEHLFAKLVTVAAGVAFVVAAGIPDVIPLTPDQVESWARLGVAGLTLLIMALGILYTVPKMSRDHRAAMNEAHAAYERTIDRICTSHAASMREMRAEQRDDEEATGKRFDTLTASVNKMQDAIHEEGKLSRMLQQQQLAQLTQIKEKTPS